MRWIWKLTLIVVVLVVAWLVWPRSPDIGRPRFFSDQTYNFEALRVIDDTAIAGGDANEAAQAIRGIRVGDAEGWYRAWQEAALSDPSLARKQVAIQAWTTGRALRLFQALQKLPGARKNVDVLGLARAMDSFFWSLLAQAVQMPKARLNQSIEAATHLIYHALFHDATIQR